MRTGRSLQHSPLFTGQEIWKLIILYFLEAPLTIKAVIKKVILLWAVWKEITKTILYHLIALLVYLFVYNLADSRLLQYFRLNLS